MSNQVSLVRTEFRNMRDMDSSYGYRIFDNYDKAYYNTLDADQVPDDDLELLKFVTETANDDLSEGILDYLRMNEAGIDIDDTWYEYDQIRHILE